VFHYTPTSCSWLNAIEGFFAKLTRRRLQRGVFRSLVDLQAAIKRFLAETNDNPNPSSGPPIPIKSIAAVRRREPSVRFDPRALRLKPRAVKLGARPRPMGPKGVGVFRRPGVAREPPWACVCNVAKFT
jgi:hypothetical protein